MFLICFLSHGELYRRRPVSHRYLTEFYLWVSFGGACGGLFVALFATHLFNDYYEWPLCLIAGVILAVTVLATGKRRTKLSVAAAAFAAVGLSALILYWEDPLHWRVASNAEYSDVRLHQSRSFYGTIAVKERRYHHAPLENYRVFYSGEITHGLQYIHPSRERLATSYYSPESGAGETLQYAMARQPSLRVAVIGLGAGTLATYARETDHYDFYEIDPDAVQVARQWFTNLSNCRAHVSRVIIGDARLKMEQLPENVKYDVILLDAFTGGSVPVHLLTQEAFQIYKRHLATDGFIAMNITNGYLNLYPVVRRQAEALGIGFRNKFQPSIRERHVRHNHYFVMTDDQEYLRRFPSVNRRFYDADGRLMRVQDPNLPDVPIWTDHFSSLTPVEIKN
jgi:spermidine synthase